MDPNLHKFTEPNDLHNDATLTNVSIKYMKEGMIWNQIMPFVDVTKRSDKYFIYDREEDFRIPDDSLGPTSRPNEVQRKMSSDNYSVKDRGLGTWVSREEEENADAPLQPMVDATEDIKDKMEMSQESRVAAVAFAPATFPASNKVTLSGTSQWGGSADDPLGTVQTAIEACWLRANTIVFGLDAWLIYRSLPEVLDAVKASSRLQDTPGGFATPEEIMNLLEVETLLVARARKTTSSKGQTATYGRIWNSKYFGAYHVERSPGIRKASFGYTFTTARDTVMTAFDEKLGVKGATFIKNARTGDEKVTSDILGYLIIDAVA